MDKTLPDQDVQHLAVHDVWRLGEKSCLRVLVHALNMPRRIGSSCVAYSEASSSRRSRQRCATSFLSILSAARARPSRASLEQRGVTLGDVAPTDIDLSSRVGQALTGLAWAARNRGLDVTKYDFATRFLLSFAPLPTFRHLSPEEYRARVAQLIREIEEEGREARDGNPVAGVEKILAQNPYEPPTRKPKPPAAAVSPTWPSG